MARNSGEIPEPSVRLTGPGVLNECGDGIYGIIQLYGMFGFFHLKLQHILSLYIGIIVDDCAETQIVVRMTYVINNALAWATVSKGRSAGTLQMAYH